MEKQPRDAARSRSQPDLGLKGAERPAIRLKPPTGGTFGGVT